MTNSELHRQEPVRIPLGGSQAPCCVAKASKPPPRFAFEYFKCTVSEETINAHTLVIVTPSQSQLCKNTVFKSLNKRTHTSYKNVATTDSELTPNLLKYKNY